MYQRQQARIAEGAIAVIIAALILMAMGYVGRQDLEDKTQMAQLEREFRSIDVSNF